MINCSVYPTLSAAVKTIVYGKSGYTKTTPVVRKLTNILKYLVVFQKTNQSSEIRKLNGLAQGYLASPINARKHAALAIYSYIAYLYVLVRLIDLKKGNRIIHFLKKD